MKNKNIDKTDLLKNIGNKLQQIRIEKEKSTKEVAAFLGISTQAYGMIERGKTDITMSRLLDIAHFYKISFSQIIDIDNNKVFNFESNNNTSCTIQNGEISNNSENIQELTNALKALLNQFQNK